MDTRTPVTDQGLRVYDDLPAATAVELAWTKTGDNPIWHERMQGQVRDLMPVLARALDRLTAGK